MVIVQLVVSFSQNLVESFDFLSGEHDFVLVFVDFAFQGLERGDFDTEVRDLLVEILDLSDSGVIGFLESSDFNLELASFAREPILDFPDFPVDF